MSHRLERVAVSCPKLPPASKPGIDGAVPHVWESVCPRMAVQSQH